MEGTSIQNSIIESKMFHIPIDEYEKDIDAILSKEKKDEILELLMNSNQLQSEEEYEEIENRLHEVCMLGNLDLIKICLQKRIKNNSKDLFFKIDQMNKTASLIKVNNIENLIVPRTVEHESIEYLITSITITDENIKSIKFSDESALSTIYSGAFSYSKIKEIYFPKSLRELKEGWCYEANNLTKIEISPLNDQFMMKEDKYLLGKTDPNSNEFDIFLFAVRDINEISIPSNIKIISSYAFYKCKKLRRIEIPPNSNLQTIESWAFSECNIEEIFIPPKVTKICEGAFYKCKSLIKVDIPLISNLQTIETQAFRESNLKKVFIPPKISKINGGVFYDCNKLKIIEIPLNSNLQTIESMAFYDSKIEEIYFPKSLRELKKGWCDGIYKLTKIIISPLNDQFIFKEDKYLLSKTDPNSDEFDNLLFAIRCIKEISIPSNIKIISSYSFQYSKIEEIFIPSKVTKICKGAFSYCHNLKKVEISLNSNLQKIGYDAFNSSNLEEIFIPPKVSKICENAFSFCFNLRKVSIPQDSNLQTIGPYAFLESRIEEILIPSQVTQICGLAFNFCRRLRKVIIPSDSNLQIIEYGAFYESRIEEIFIPSKVSMICENAFFHCAYLTKVEFALNSNLQTIESNAFSLTSLKSIFVPPKISKICDEAFNTELQIVEISEKSELESFPLLAFKECPNVIIMIPSSLEKLIQVNIIQ